MNGKGRSAVKMHRTASVVEIIPIPNKGNKRKNRN